MLEENIELEEQKDSNRNDIEVDGQNQVVTDGPRMSKVQIDGWETGGRAPAKTKEELRYYMRCKTLCCPLGSACSNRCYEAGMTRCWCCFDRMHDCTESFLIDENIPTRPQTYEQIEEWFRSFNCQPLPLVTIITTIIEVAYFMYLRGLPGDYNDNILASPLLWRYERKSVWYIWITYSFCHGSVTHLLSNLFLKVFLGLFVEMEHKWLRVLIIYSLGVALGALFHSVVNPCTPLCGSSGGCYALLGAGIIKFKRHYKYIGRIRRNCNFSTAAIILLLTAADLVYTLFNWFTCSPATNSTAISAHVGGLVAGLCVAYWALNKFQESWGQNIYRKHRYRYQAITDEDVQCCAYKHCYEAWITNADCIKLLKDWKAWLFLGVLIASFVFSICLNTITEDDGCVASIEFNRDCYQL